MGKKSRQRATGLSDEARPEEAIRRQRLIEKARTQKRAQDTIRLLKALTYRALTDKMVIKVRETCECHYSVRPPPEVCRGCSKVVEEMEKIADALNGTKG